MSETKVKISKPAAYRDVGTTDFFVGALEGQLKLQHCKTCAKHSLTGACYCPHCLSPVQWMPASGRGTLYTWTHNHQVVHPAFAEETPYLSGIVELEEGPLLLARLIDLNLKELRIGLPVRVRFINPDEGDAIPAFGPV